MLEFVDGRFLGFLPNSFLASNSLPSLDAFKTVVIVTSQCCFDFLCRSMSDGIPFEMV